MYSFSTCWNSHRHIDGRAMLREIRDLGLEWAELSHGIRISLLPGIIDAVQAGEIKISSVHNFCPLPLAVNHAAPDLYRFSSPDRRERENAFRHSVRSIETAARLGAQVVVLHMGRIEMRDYNSKLFDLIQDGKRESEKYGKLCDEAIEKRERRKEEYTSLACEMLGRLIPEADKHGIKLGIENRERIEDIPTEADMSSFLHEHQQPAVGYWHDIGHAQIKHNLGFIDHAFHLKSLANRLFGFHVHDVEYPGRDHASPGTGGVDFAALKPMLKPEHIKVFELSPRLAVEDVKRGIAYVKETWGEQ